MTFGSLDSFQRSVIEVGPIALTVRREAELTARTARFTLDVFHEPFEPSAKFGTRVREAGLRNGIVTYPGSGMADGARGDIISLYPPLIVSDGDIADNLLLESLSADYDFESIFHLAALLSTKSERQPRLALVSVVPGCALADGSSSVSISSTLALPIADSVARRLSRTVTEASRTLATPTV